MSWACLTDFFFTCYDLPNARVLSLFVCCRVLFMFTVISPVSSLLQKCYFWLKVASAAFKRLFTKAMFPPSTKTGLDLNIGSNRTTCSSIFIMFWTIWYEANDKQLCNNIRLYAINRIISEVSNIKKNLLHLV